VTTGQCTKVFQTFRKLGLFVLQSKKPQMEKLRRARINESLNELKSLVLDATKKDVRPNFLIKNSLFSLLFSKHLALSFKVSRYSKMEKADILEMTVKYLRESKDKQSKSNPGEFH
jgi:hypothetical protein